MLEITGAAAAHLKTLLNEHPSPAKGLRVYVEKGGCAGFQYEMKLDDPKPEDVVSEREGVSVMVDPASLPYLANATLDYCDDLTGTGFRIQNPNAARSCGCGTSFEPAAAASGGGAAGA